MKLLLSNDDGINAPGITALAAALAEMASIEVIAPLRDCSGVSNSLTLHRPIHAQRLENGYIALDGTPTDCVHLGTSGLLISLPDRVVSGINYGANLGDDVLYSGTVAAAMEGRFLGKPPVAISLVTRRAEMTAACFQNAALISRALIRLIDQWQVLPRTVFNINIPDLPPEEIRGIRITTLGQRLKGENPIKTQNPRGKVVYWIGRAGGPVEEKEGSDFHAVANGYISITPIQTDLTSYRECELLNEVAEMSLSDLQL